MSSCLKKSVVLQFLYGYAILYLSFQFTLYCIAQFGVMHNACHVTLLAQVSFLKLNNNCIAFNMIIADCNVSRLVLLLLIIYTLLVYLLIYIPILLLLLQLQKVVVPNLFRSHPVIFLMNR
jgi:hypothetical protein